VQLRTGLAAVPGSNGVRTVRPGSCRDKADDRQSDLIGTRYSREASTHARLRRWREWAAGPAGPDQWQVAPGFRSCTAGDATPLVTRQKILAAHGVPVSTRGCRWFMFDLRRCETLEGRILGARRRLKGPPQFHDAGGHRRQSALRLSHSLRWQRHAAEADCEQTGSCRLRKQFVNGRPLLEIR